MPSKLGEESGTMRRSLDWSLFDHLPVLELFRCPGIALRGRMLLCGLALWLMCLAMHQTLSLPNANTIGLASSFTSTSSIPTSADISAIGLNGLFPFANWGSIPPRLRAVLGQPLRLALTTTVLSGLALVFAVAARMAAFEIGREERIGLWESGWYTLQRTGALFGSIGLALLALASLSLYFLLQGLMLSNTLSAALAWLLFPVSLAAGALFAFFLFGSVLGIPFSLCAVVIEGADAFDGLSRGFSYATQQPFRLLAYILAALFLLATCSAAMTLLVEFAEDALLGMVKSAIYGVSNENKNGYYVSAWRWMFWAFLGSWRASFCGTLITCLYVLRRKDIDDASMDAIHRTEETRNYELPPLTDDEQGVPQPARKADEVVKPGK